MGEEQKGPFGAGQIINVTGHGGRDDTSASQFLDFAGPVQVQRGGGEQEPSPGPGLCGPGNEDAPFSMMERKHLSRRGILCQHYIVYY